MKFVLLILCFLSLPGFAQEDDEKLLDDLEADRRRQTEAAVRLNESQEEITGRIKDFPTELKKLGYESIDAAALMDEKVVKLVRDAMKQSPLQRRTPEEVKAHILKQSEGSFIHDYLASSPKLMDAIVDVLRDEKALSSAIGMFLRKDDLQLYFFIWIGFMILAWLFKKIFFNDKWPKYKRSILGILVSLCFTTLSVGTFYQMFHDELSPAATILLKHWRKRNLN